MTIQFHCPKCGKEVRAPDDAGGHQGKCPGCHQSVYIPMPEDKVEPLDFAPIDEEAEEEQKRLEEETRALRREVMSDTTLPADTGGPGRSDSAPAVPTLDMDTLIVQYATAMAQGKLNEAAEFAGVIRRDMSAAEDAIQRLMSDEILPGPLEATPRPVLVAFFKQLRSGKI